MFLIRFVRIPALHRCYVSEAKGTRHIPNVFSTQGNEDFSDPGVPKVACTKDGSTIVMYHPKPTLQYEDTIPVPRDDPRYTTHENIESLVREKLDDLNVADKPLDKKTIDQPWPLQDKETIPTMMHLANMFYTTKHIWFPNRGLRKKRPPGENS